MERHGIAVAEDLISAEPYELSHIYNLNLPQSEIEWLQLLVTVDTVFILECICSISPDEGAVLCMQLWRDLLLIGNQIPMSFLKKTSGKLRLEIVNLEKNVRDFTVQRNPFFFNRHVSSRFLRFLDSNNKELIHQCDHLLDSVYYSCTLEEEEEEEEEEESTTRTIYEESQQKYGHLPSAFQLYNADIRFKACEGNI